MYHWSVQIPINLIATLTCIELACRLFGNGLSNVNFLLIYFPQLCLLVNLHVRLPRFVESNSLLLKTITILGI